MVPESVLEEISWRVKRQWPEDEEMQRFYLLEEVEAYAALEETDLEELGHMKAELISAASQLYDAWDDIWTAVRAESAAYRGLEDFDHEEIGDRVIDAWKQHAKAVSPQSYSDQLAFVERKAEKYLSVMKTREQVDPIKKLLIELEKIIGSECYNGNIQNFASWGELESEGRQIRYPVTFYSESQKSKRWIVPEDVPSEELITGYYAFGANELNIYRALVKVISHLRVHYGLEV